MRKVIRAALLFLFSNLSAQNIPADESHLDHTFAIFKADLEYAVSHKDSIRLKSLLAERIGNGMQDYYVKDDFFSYNADRSRNIDAWDKLNRVLKYGFHRGSGETMASLKDTLEFTAPSYLYAINKGKEQGNNFIAILTDGLNVREKPGLKSNIIRKIPYGLYTPFLDKDHNILNFISPDNTEWLKIRLPNGKPGFIAKKYTSEYLYVTLVVSKHSGEWKITEFYGDTRNW